NARALDELYGRAAVPAPEAFAGDMRGLLLAWPAAPGALGRALQAFGRSVPWRGKSFVPGEGVNRLFADRMKLFQFSTSIGPSRTGSGQAFLLDYDRPENPFFIRAIKDELRELRPGLYLGQGWLVVGGRARLMLYFALQAG